MSRPYRILVRKAIREEVRVGDRSTIKLNLDDILPPEEMKAILEEVLARHGWERTEEGWKKDRGQGEVMTLDLDTLEVVTTVEREEVIERVVEREARGDTWNWRRMREMTEEELRQDQERLRRQVEKQLEQELNLEQLKSRRQQELQEEILRHLEETEPERREELNRIVLEVYAEALKQKARSLGEIEEMREEWRSNEEYELVISIAEA